MGKSSRSSFFWPSLFTAFMLLLFLSLGSWQLYRLSWKEALLARMGEKLSRQNLTLPDLHDVTPETLQEIEFRKLRITGRFLHEHEHILLARPQNGHPGIHVITPFQSEQGLLLLVDRGWAPASSRPPLNQTSETISLEGIIRLESPPSFFTPSNDYEKKELYRIAPLEIGKETSLPLLPFFLQQTEPPSDQPPYPITTLPKMRNPHLGYAITWFSLALLVLALFIVFRRNHSKK